MNDPITYCNIYRISPKLAPILEKLPKRLWYVFNGKSFNGDKVTVSTGFYSGVGFTSKRQDITPEISNACRAAGFKTEFYVDKEAAPRGGVKGNRLIITR